MNPLKNQIDVIIGFDFIQNIEAVLMACLKHQINKFYFEMLLIINNWVSNSTNKYCRIIHSDTNLFFNMCK